MPTLTQQLTALAQQLTAFQEAEYAAQREEITKTWALPLSERVRKGSAIGGVKLLAPLMSDDFRKGAAERLRRAGIEPTEERIQNNFKSLVAFTNTVSVAIPANNSNFKVGSHVLLHRGDPHDQENAYPVEIYRDAGNKLVLDAEHGRNPRGRAPSDGWILDADIRDFRWILQKALDALPTATANSALTDILLHRTPPTFSETARATAQALVPGLGLNERQQEAFVNAYAAENYYLIQGPPGTGKTWVLAQLAAALARAGQRVLVTSSNHLAINNALAKIHQATGYPHLVKVGKTDQAEGLAGVPNHAYRPDLTPIAGQAFIVGGTVHSLYTSRLSNTRFDVVIADEASQLTMVQAVGVLLAGSRFVFIGDHQQMPPIITAEHPHPEHRQSIFQYLFAFAPGTLLDTTYRLHAALAEFSSSQFYGGQLRSHPSAATRTLQLPVAPAAYADVLDPGQPSVFIDLRHANPKTYERSEAHYISDLIAELLASGVPAAEIAVVAPYRAQGRAIRHRLGKRCADRNAEELAGITIDTVERMQGQEREVILLSLTSGCFDAALQRASFYFLPNRLNVAITRARVKRIVVGSSRLTQTRFDSPELQQWANSFSQFLDSCHRITRLHPLKRPRPVAR